MLEAVAAPVYEVLVVVATAYFCLLMVVRVERVQNFIRAKIHVVGLGMDDKAYAAAVGTAVTVIAVALAVIFGAIIIGNVQGSLPTGLDNQTQTLITNVVNNVFSAFNLMSTGIIVLVAGFILTILVAGFLVRR
jgi:hypothetical protein